MSLDRSAALDYSGLGCQCRLNKGGTLFRRTRYQQGSLRLEERKRGSAVWVYRWWENDITGKSIRRKVQLGSLERYPNESAACAAADALRLTINNQSKRKNLQKTTVNILWEHYCREEMPLKEISTQDAYLVYGKNWILPRWGKPPFGGHQDHRGRTLATSSRSYGRDQSQDQVRYVGCVLACRSLGVLWPQSNFIGNTSWNGGQRGPSTGVRVSAKRQKSPLVLSPEEVILGLAQLEFRDQILVFLDGALGIRQGELGALRWLDCDFNNMNFSVQHSYYWRRGGHLKSTKTEASAKLLPMHPSLKLALLEWRSLSLYNQPGDFVFPSERLKGKKPLDLASVLKKKIQPAFKRIGITGVGWHTFRHTVGTMLAEMGEHQLMIRDYLRHSDLHVTNKYLQATTKSKRLAQGKLVDAILPGGVLSGSKSTLIH